ncbi:hypothetical protein [Bacillus sp. JJ722]|uniref:hypothetical protein n=1 Tax=Bacillus sp. JJ722 TaxID=3122973 RepID=UPI002FFF2679
MKIVKSLIYIGVSLSLLSGCSGNEDDQSLEKGLELLKEQKYSEATTYFEDALKVKDDKKEAEKYIEQAKLINQTKNAINDEDYEQASSYIKAIESMKDVKVDYVLSDLNDLKEQIDKGQQELGFKLELEKIRTLIADKEFESAESKLETLENLIGDDSDLSKKLKETADLLNEKKREQVAVATSPKQQPVNEPEEEKSETISYNTYTNERFGFTVKYPNFFTPGKAPANNDGREFSNGECSILAYGSNINIIEENETIQTYYNRALLDISGTISYQKVSDNWYVVSYLSNGNITYQKGIITDESINTLIITYPSSEKEKYDTIVSEVAKTFQTGYGNN